MSRELDPTLRLDSCADHPLDGFMPCPLGFPQATRECLGFYERGERQIQLRFGALDNEGLCDLVLEEDSDRPRNR